MDAITKMNRPPELQEAPICGSETCKDYVHGIGLRQKATGNHVFFYHQLKGVPEIEPLNQFIDMSMSMSIYLFIPFYDPPLACLKRMGGWSPLENKKSNNSEK